MWVAAVSATSAGRKGARPAAEPLRGDSGMEAETMITDAEQESLRGTERGESKGGVDGSSCDAVGLLAGGACAVVGGGGCCVASGMLIGGRGGGGGGVSAGGGCGAARDWTS